MIFDFYNKKIKVFVADVNPDVEELQKRLIKVLGSAGMDVICAGGQAMDFEENLAKLKQYIQQADCSVHLIGKSFSAFREDGQKYLAKDHFLEAQNRNNSEWRDFKIFIWHPSQFNEDTEKDEDDFITDIRQGIMPNMIYSNRNSIVAFVEDLRSVMFGGKPELLETEETEIFFVYNAIDQDSAEEIISFIEDVSSIKKLEIILSAETDYSELIVQQSKKSKMVVVYFKNTGSWALPFIQQIWKLTGGASSETPILFIGDANIESNQSIDFEAEMVVQKIVPHEIIPVEIKVHLDNITES
ncbi:MAG: hypothetical protein U0W24_26600 [Bacteroidales bacterium]